jgi:phage-related holin
MGHLNYAFLHNPALLAQLLLAVSLQLILVVVMIHGVRSERRSLLLPYIIYASVAILAGCAQVGIKQFRDQNNLTECSSSAWLRFHAY